MKILAMTLSIIWGPFLFIILPFSSPSLFTFPSCSASPLQIPALGEFISLSPFLPRETRDSDLLRTRIPKFKVSASSSLSSSSLSSLSPSFTPGNLAPLPHTDTNSGIAMWHKPCEITINDPKIYVLYKHIKFLYDSSQFDFLLFAGLFHRAVILSSTTIATFAYYPPESHEAEHTFDLLLEQTNCTENSKDASVECLRRLGAHDLKEAEQYFLVIVSSVTVSFCCSLSSLRKTKVGFFEFRL